MVTWEQKSMKQGGGDEGVKQGGTGTNKGVLEVGQK